MDTPTPQKTITVDGVTLSIWTNDVLTDDGVRRRARVTVERRFLDPEGVMRAVRSFRARNLPAVALAVQRAQRYLMTEPGNERTYDARTGAAPVVRRPIGIPRYVRPIP